MIHNCLINTEDYIRVDHIYGPARPLLQGGMKLRRNPAERVPRFPLPTDIFLYHNNIELYFDFFMNGIPFPHTIVSKIALLAAENCILNSAENIIK